MEEFHQRRREAAANKARGGAQLRGPLLPPPPPASSHPHSPPHPQPELRNKAEQVRLSVGLVYVQTLLLHLQEYLARLEVIRKQNFLERRRIQQQVAGNTATKPPALDPDARRRKIAALKAQADLEAEKMRQRIVEKQRERVAVQQQRQQDKEEEDDREDKGTDAAGESDSPTAPAEQLVRGRPQWAASPNVAVGFACQPEATGRVTAEGELVSTVPLFCTHVAHFCRGANSSSF